MGEKLTAEKQKHADQPHRTKHRDAAEQKALINRLNRIEGQIRGLKGMLEKEAYCIDVLTQVAATRSALNSFAKELLSAHIRGCVADDLKHGNDASVGELVETVQKLLKG